MTKLQIIMKILAFGLAILAWFGDNFLEWENNSVFYLLGSFATVFYLTSEK